MSEVSFVISGDNVSNSSIDAISKKIRSVNKEDEVLADVVLYFTEQPTPSFSRENISVVYSSEFSSAIKSAVIAASGRRIVFTTVQNLVKDRRNEMLNQAISSPVSSVGVPVCMPFLGKVLGPRLLLKVQYLITDREFMVQAAPEFKNFRQLILRSDRQLGLFRMSPLDLSTSEYIIRHQIFLRPYWAIFKNRFDRLGTVSKWKRSIRPRNREPMKKPIEYSPDMPVFIISRDRLDPLKKLVKWCESEGLKNLIFIDNCSTYPPLLRYLSSTPYKTIRLASNIGQTSPWQTRAVDIYAPNEPFIVTDSDIVPTSDAHGAVKVFCKLLNNYPGRIKAGFGLMIDDIPDTYDLKDYVIAWEKQFWEKEIEKNVYDADIDTTFAVNRQGTPYDIRDSLRTGGRFVARHDTWYTNSKNPSAEMNYYRAHADKTIGSWGIDSKELSHVYHEHKHKPTGRKPNL